MIGRVVLDFVADEAGARARWGLMATGQLDGYHVIARECRRLDGTEFTVDTCVNSFAAATPNGNAIGMLLPQSSSRSITEGSADETGAVMLGTVDGEWRIDRISAAVEHVLGHLPADVVGEPISAFVEPTDLPRLLVGVGRGLQGPGGAM